MRHALTLSENVDRFFISLNSDNMVKNDIVERGGEMKRWIVSGIMMFFLSGCTNPLTPSPLPTELPPAPITEWTREDFKDIYDEYDQVEPLLDALKKNGITPFRETFERVIIAAHGLEHTMPTFIRSNWMTAHMRPSTKGQMVRLPMGPNRSPLYFGRKRPFSSSSKKSRTGNTVRVHPLQASC